MKAGILGAAVQGKLIGLNVLSDLYKAVPTIMKAGKVDHRVKCTLWPLQSTGQSPARR